MLRAQDPKSLEKKQPKSNSKVGFGGIQEVGHKVGPKVGLYCRGEEQNVLSDLLFDLFPDFSPETYF